MKLTKYEIFLKILEFGSLSKAAEYYNYSQSAISQIVQSLEQEMGLTLISRSRSGVSLTSEGEQLLPFIREIHQAQVRLSTRIFEIRELQSGVIRIGAFTSVACHLLPSLIQVFKIRYPNIDFELKQGDYVETESWALDGAVDFSVVKLPSKLETTNIYRDPMKVIMPSNHPFANLDAIPIENLADMPFIMLEPGNNDDLNRIFKAHGIYPKVEHRVRDDYTIMAMVEKGLGLSILPELVLNRTPYDIVSKPTNPPTFRTLAVGVKESTQLPRAAETFINLLLKSYRDN